MRITDITAAARVNGPWLAVLLLCPVLAHAADWQVAPALELGSYYTDNVTRVEEHTQESVVTTVAPELLINGAGRDYQIFIDYRYIHNFYSDDGDANRGYNQLSANGDQLLGQGLITYWNGGISQQVTDPADGLDADVGSRGGNISDTRHLVSGLRGKRDGDWMRASGDVSGRLVNSDRQGFENTTGYDGVLLFQQGVATGPWFYDARLNGSAERYNDLDAYRNETGELVLGRQVDAGFGIYGRYFDDQAHIGDAPRQQLRSAGGGVRYHPGDHLTLDVGYNTSVDGGDYDDYVSARLDWRLSSRTRIAANYGQRYFGDSWDISAEQGTRKLRQSLNYSESVTTTSRAITQVSGIPVACTPDKSSCQLLAEGEQAPEGMSPGTAYVATDAISNRVYLSKLWRYNLALVYHMHTINFSLYSDDRLFSDDLENAEHKQDEGAKLFWRLGLTPVSAVTANAWWRHYGPKDADTLDREWRTGLGYERTPNSSSRWIFDGSYITRDAVAAGSSYDKWRLGLSYTYYL